MKILLLDVMARGVVDSEGEDDTSNDYGLKFPMAA